MGQYNLKKNSEFVNGIVAKYQRNQTENYYGPVLIYRKQKKETGNTIIKQNLNRIITKEFYTRIKHYENKYYQQVTSLDNRKLIQTIEQIYNQPGEKRQLIHVLKKLGVVTKNQREWQETRQILKKYEEELTQLKREITYQEEYLLKLENKEGQRLSTKLIAREVMESIKREIQMERLRYGLD